MRKSNKAVDAEHTGLKAWVEGQDESTWKTFQNPLKSEVLAALSDEQDGYCCYCGRLLDLDLPNCTIEHHAARNRDDQNLAVSEQEIFAYQNLFATCGPGSLAPLQHGPKPHPTTCGAAKAKNADPKNKAPLRMRPTDLDCEISFDYGATGIIAVSRSTAEARKSDAKQAIEVLALDHPVLKDDREDAITTSIKDLVDNPLSYSTDDIRRFIDALTKPKKYGHRKFAHVLVRYLETAFNVKRTPE